MNVRKAPALVLAAALQILPLSRVAIVNQSVAPTGFAIVMPWLAGAVTLLGSYHAVSGASAAIAGVYDLSPVGPVTTNASGTVNQPFAYQIYVTNPGVNPQQAYYSASPLPPGLNLSTNIGGNGIISGTPTVAGVYSPVTLIAGNANFAGTVTLNIEITITGAGGSPPVISSPPKSQTVQTGTNVSFTVSASGAAPLTYAWKFNGSPLAGASTSRLDLTAVQTTNSGTYAVTVANTAGSAAASATLTVTAPAAGPFQLANVLSANGSWSFDVTGPSPTNYIIWSSTDLAHWTARLTNSSPTGTLHFSESNTTTAVEFYRATLSP